MDYTHNAPAQPMKMPAMQEQAQTRAPLNRARQVIGPEQVRQAMEILQKYKDAKADLENRIIEDERWYKMQHWALIAEKHGDRKSVV